MAYLTVCSAHQALFPGDGRPFATMWQPAAQHCIHVPVNHPRPPGDDKNSRFCKWGGPEQGYKGKYNLSDKVFCPHRQLGRNNRS